MEMASSSQPSKSGSASVQFGIYKQNGGFAGKTVKQIREERGKLWGIPTDANAYLGSQKLDEDYVLQPDDQVEFHEITMTVEAA